MVERKNIKLTTNSSRVILKFFYLKSEQRIRNIVQRVSELSDSKVDSLFNQVMSDFSQRHKNIENTFILHFNKINEIISGLDNISQTRKLLIGSYFTMEYSIESAALFNPSIVPHPDQSGLNAGELRFVMSLRATGEGHISSIEFRSGIIDGNNQVILDNAGRYAITATEREDGVVAEFGNESTAHANYNISFSGDEPLSERVIFPYSKTELNGMEDVRLVRFRNDDDSLTYYGTFTAYDGYNILSEVINTDDFISFKIRALYGEKAKDKGMALFPRKINNKYSIISRIDGENLFFMQSDNMYVWNDAQLLRTPQFDWEFIQTGNCGSPIETEEGWLLITHSVGPMRRYVISAILLDIDDPSKVIGYLDEPLIEPTEEEREGYVPNVVYSCGSLIHNNQLIMPYAVSDSASGFATVPLEKLFKKFIRQ